MGNTPRQFPLHTPIMTPAVPRRRIRTPLGSVPTPISDEESTGPVLPVLTAEELADGRVKGEMLSRIWMTFRLRAHDRKVLAYLPPELVEKLYNNDLLANTWYPIEHYLLLYRALLKVCGRDELIDTSLDSSLRGLKKGSWHVFVPVIADFAPDVFCGLLAKRFLLVWKHSFQAAALGVSTPEEGGADFLVDAPWAVDPAFQAAVSGSLLAICTYAGLKGTCTVAQQSRTRLCFELRWSRR